MPLPINLVPDAVQTSADWRHIPWSQQRWRLRRPSWREARRSAGAGANKVRSGDQSQDREGARHRNSADPARPRRRGDRMKTRRDVMSLLAGGAAAWPLTARTQTATLPLIGFVRSATLSDVPHLINGFRQGLNEVGFVEARNVVVDYRSADGRN